MNKHIFKNKSFLILFAIVLIWVGQFSQFSEATTTQLNVIDAPPNYDWIYPNETQFFSVYNDAETFDLTVNFTVLMAYDSENDYADLVMDIFTWDGYKPGKQTGDLAHVESSTYFGEAAFSCSVGRYLIRLKNEYIDSTELSTYNITFRNDEDVDIPVSAYNFQEQNRQSGAVSVASFYTIDPWLFDSYTSEKRLTIIGGYTLYSARAPITASGERWFWIKNYEETCTLWVGLNAYNLNPARDTPMATITVSDWEDLDNGDGALKQGDIDAAYRVNEYSAGFNFTCEKDHTYQVWIKNVDSSYSLFFNLSLYSWGTNNIDYDNDLTLDPGAEVLVRGFLYDPWLDYKRERRRVMWYWILGGTGGVGLVFGIIWIRVRYL